MDQNFYNIHTSIMHSLLCYVYYKSWYYPREKMWVYGIQHNNRKLGRKKSLVREIYTLNNHY